MHVCRGHQLPRIQGNDERIPDVKYPSSLLIDDVYSQNSGGKTKRDAAEKTDLTPNLDVKTNYTSDILRRLFQRYGNGDAVTFEGFEHLLENLGLSDIVIDHNVDVHKSWNNEQHSNHDHRLSHGESKTVLLGDRGRIYPTDSMQNKSVDKIETVSLDDIQNGTSYNSQKVINFFIGKIRDDTLFYCKFWQKHFIYKFSRKLRSVSKIILIYHKLSKNILLNFCIITSLSCCSLTKIINKGNKNHYEKYVMPLMGNLNLLCIFRSNYFV